MTGAGTRAWARLRLVQGDADEKSRELTADLGQTTVTVGSGPSSSWMVLEEGVRPLHFSLHWDGAMLRIADTHGAGDVRADGNPVSAQWRALSGRVRIDFGKGAIVVETSSGSPASSGEVFGGSAALVDPSSAAAASAGAAAASAAGGDNLDAAAAAIAPGYSAQMHKSTLIGVSPLADLRSDDERRTPSDSGRISGPPSEGRISSMPTGRSSNPPPSGRASSVPPDFRVTRPSESERARRATLMGVAVSIPPPSEMAPELRDIVDTTGSAPSSTPAPGIPTGTLIGMMSPLADGSVQRLNNVNVGQPSPSSSSPAPSSVTQAQVRTISASPATARIGSTWQEVSGTGSVPLAQLVDPDLERLDSESERFRRDSYDRYSDAPTQMRDTASIESKRPKRSFPWGYVGIGFLTVAAYLAWLYLLDHL